MLCNTLKRDRQLKPVGFKCKNKLDIITRFEEKSTSYENNQVRPKRREDNKDRVNLTPSA